MSDAREANRSPRHLARGLHQGAALLQRILVTGLLMLSLTHAVPAHAQGDSKVAAKVHFQKGVAAFNERRYAAAADEFETAYRLSPAYVVLYNIGQVNVALGKPVEAVQAFDEYLKQGASSIAASRRDEVQAEIEEQRRQIGTLNIVAYPDQVEIRIDGKLIGTTPLAAPVRVKAGHHTVEALLAPRQPELRELEVPGQATLDIELTLAEPAAVAPAPAVVPPSAPPPPVQSAPTPVVVNVESARAPAAPSGAPEPAARHGVGINWMRTGGYALAAAGVVVATGGVLYAIRGANEASEARSRMAVATTPDEYDAAQPDYDLGKARNQRGWVITAAGGAGVLVGLLVVLAAPDRSSAATLAPLLTAHGAGVELAHRF